jgi:hypothetical protein
MRLHRHVLDRHDLKRVLDKKIALPESLREISPLDRKVVADVGPAEEVRSPRRRPLVSA